MRKRPKSKAERGLVTMRIVYASHGLPRARHQELKVDVRRGTIVDVDHATGLVAVRTTIPLREVRIVSIEPYYLTHLAEAFARPGKQRDLEAAAGKGIAAIHLAEGLSSTLNVDRIHDLIRQLKPHAKLPAVREFLERAQGFAQR